MNTQTPLPEARSTHATRNIHQERQLTGARQTRAHILLLTDRGTGEGRSDAEIADALLCNTTTVANVCKRCQAGVQAALVEKPRPGRATKITGDLEAQISEIAWSDPRERNARWTVLLLTARVVELLGKSPKALFIDHTLKGAFCKSPEE